MRLITALYFSIGISDGNPDVNSIADSEWTVVWSALGIQFHVPSGRFTFFTFLFYCHPIFLLLLSNPFSYLWLCLRWLLASPTGQQGPYCLELLFCICCNPSGIVNFYRFIVIYFGVWDVCLNYHVNELHKTCRYLNRTHILYWHK